VRDLALERSVLQLVAEDLPQRMGVNTTARHILCAAVFATFHNQNGLLSLSQLISSYEAGHTAADDNSIKIVFDFFSHVSPFRFPNKTMRSLYHKLRIAN